MEKKIEKDKKFEKKLGMLKETVKIFRKFRYNFRKIGGKI